MSHILQSGSIFSVSGSGSNILNELPAANYVLKSSPMTGFYLEQVDNFKLPEKLYGDCCSNSYRVLNTFKQRERNTGVLLVGQKGSGKTLLMRKISIDSGLPVIIINSPFTGDNFNSFLSSICQPCIILFDEFEKIYDKDDQEQVLTLLDGTYQSNKLFLITSNDKWKLDTNMKNRPGRIYYMFEFKGLCEAFIREYCEDNLVDKSKINRIVALSLIFDEFNFDMLAAIVEEVNRYGEEPSDLLRVLNVKPEYCDRQTYEVTANIGDIIVPKEGLDQKIKFNPYLGREWIHCKFCWDNTTPNVENIENTICSPQTSHDLLADWLEQSKIYFGNKSPNIPSDNNDWGSLSMELTPDYIVKIDGRSVIYQLPNGFVVTLNKVEDKKNLAYGYSEL